jgi:hypothetical protein
VAVDFVDNGRVNSSVSVGSLVDPATLLNGNVKCGGLEQFRPPTVSVIISRKRYLFDDRLLDKFGEIQALFVSKHKYNLTDKIGQITSKSEHIASSDL